MKTQDLRDPIREEVRKMIKESSAVTGDKAKIESFLLASPEFEDASPSEIKMATKYLFDEWKNVAGNYKNIFEYLDELENTGGLEGLFEADTNPADIVKLDIPLLIRIMEYSKEDAKSDMDLHAVAEKIIKKSKSGKVLSMKDYNELVSISKITEAETTSSTNESKYVLLMRSDNRHCFYKVMGFPKKVGDPVTFDNSKYKVAYVGKDKNDVLAFINTFKKRIFQMLDYNKL